MSDAELADIRERAEESREARLHEQQSVGVLDVLALLRLVDEQRADLYDLREHLLNIHDGIAARMMQRREGGGGG